MTIKMSFIFGKNRFLFFYAINILINDQINDTQVEINKIFERKIVNIFLSISFNICFGCTKEPSH